MNIRSVLWGVLVSCLLGAVAPVGAAGPAPQGESLASIAQLPDWSGSWRATTYLSQLRKGGGPFNVDAPLNATATARLEELRRISDAGGDVPTKFYHCVPHGLPGGMDGPTLLMEILFTPKRVTMVSEEGWYRTIYTDGRQHNDQSVSFQGDSTGHWEAGSTLVVDTIGLDPGNEFILGIEQGKNSHLTERIHLRGPDTLIDEMVFEAPDVLTKPWTMVKTFKRTHFALVEADCAQNNRDVAPDGRQGFNLTPPPQ